MKAPAVLGALRRLGVVLWVEGDTLHYRAPADTLDAKLREQLQAYKWALMELVRRDHVVTLAQSKGFPGLYAYGRYVGAGEMLWRKFAQRCHAAWLPLAVQALESYEPSVPSDGVISED
ncbi:MAG: hypothetical protein ACK47B_09145 [Armatimonadota bacterium]